MSSGCLGKVPKGTGAAFLCCASSSPSHTTSGSEGNCGQAPQVRIGMSKLIGGII